MHSRRIVDFYAAFKRLDPAAMRAAYAPGACFSNPLFQLQGTEEIGALWAMVCAAIDRKRVDQWRLEVSEVEATAHCGRARCQPHWRIRASGRVVQGVTDAEFSFDRDGRILSHVERFSFWHWSRQALGLRGALLGWTPLWRDRVGAWARQSLRGYLPSHRSTVQLLRAAARDEVTALG